MEKKSCRACLNENSNIKEYNSLYNCINIKEINKTLKLSQMMFDCTSVDCQECDGLPNFVCEPCTKEIQNAYLFREKCLTSQTILRNKVLSDIKIVDSEIIKIENESNISDVIPFIKCEEVKSVENNQLINESEDCLAEYDIEYSNASAENTLDADDVAINSEPEESESDLPIQQLVEKFKEQKLVLKPLPPCKNKNDPQECDLCGKTYKNYQSLKVTHI